MKRKIILSDSEITSIINELEVSINSTSDYTEAMYLSNIIKKLKNDSDNHFYSKQPHNPVRPLSAAR